MLAPAYIVDYVELRLVLCSFAKETGMMRVAANAAALTMLFIASSPHAYAAAAADYPTKPIRFVVPVAPGGTPDVIARVVGGELTKQMGQQVVIDNRAGANGAIGMLTLTR